MSEMKFLRKIVTALSFFLVVFIFGIKDVSAANFKYSEFDFEDFSKQYANYWGSYCNSEKCVDNIIKSQEKFYTRLYDILASYEEHGYFIDDLLIIATAYFEYNPENFNDDDNSYNYQNDSLRHYFFNPLVESADSYAREDDTLKLLINAMVGFERVCYGESTPIPIYAEEEETTDEDTDEEEEKSEEEEPEIINYECSNGFLDADKDGNPICSNPIHREMLTFWEYFAAKLGWGKFFGLKSDKVDNCQELTSSQGYVGGHSEISEQMKVSEEAFWQFLEDGNYFDKKDRLQYRYKTILKELNKDKMSELTDEEYEEYDKKIKRIRKGIVNDIKSIVKLYRQNRPPANFNNANSKLMWWPVGSAETTESNGLSFASDEPVSMTVINKYGMVYDKDLKKVVKHNGIDLTANGNPGEVSVVAAKAGTVFKVNDTCTSSDDSTCGDEYGNYVMIMHNNGMYTVYAFLYPGSVTVKEGDSVRQGQIIGMMGSHGTDNKPFLHFEVRTGPEVDSSVNPLEYVDPENPRPFGALSEDFLAMVKAFEGSGPIEGSNYVVYQEATDVPTVGYGVTLIHNYDVFAQVGYPLTCGSPSNSFGDCVGQRIPMEVVDQVFAVEIEKWSNYVIESLANAGVSLEQYQIDALTDLCYNGGERMGDFLSQYSYRGATPSLCGWWDEYFTRPLWAYSALHTRRKKECDLFLYGVYNGGYDQNFYRDGIR